MENKKIGICTLGCRVNRYESDAIAAELIQHGYEIADFSESCGAYIVNTCTVTSESDRKSRQMIRRCKTINPGAFVAVCGCFSQLNASSVSEYADYVCGTRNKSTVIEAIDAFYNGENYRKTNVPAPSGLAFERMPIPKTSRTRAYVKIEDGCNNKCAYCVIPFARGSVVSRNEDEIIEQLNGLAAAGYPEIVLTGIETAAYGLDTGKTLTGLLKRAEEIEGIQRIRLGSLDPAWLRPDISRELSQFKKLMPHFHLSVQSGSKNTLNAMKRGYNPEILHRNIDALRGYIPGVRFSADIIVGFPGETEEDFNKSREFIEYAELIHAHIFPYSKREGTAAAEMKCQIPQQEKARRAKELEEASARVTERINSAVEGKIVSVLFETRDGEYYYGHGADFSEVRALSQDDLRGKIRDVTILSHNGEILTGKING